MTGPPVVQEGVSHVNQRPDERNEWLYPAMIVAGWVSVLALAGMLYVAVDRRLNHVYVQWIILTIVALVTGLVVSMVRRARRRRLG